MFNKNYYQYFPVISCVIWIIVAISIFPNPNEYLKYTEDELINSTTFEAISGDPFRSALLVSVGLLLPFMINFLVSLIFSRHSRRKLDLYLLILLVCAIQSINIYYIYSIHNPSLRYFWNYHLCQFIKISVLCNVIFSLQMYYAKHDPTMIRTLFIATNLINFSFIFKIVSAVLGIPFLGYASMACFGLTIVANLYVAYLWYSKYSYSKRSGLQTYQQDFFALVEISMLIFYLVLYLVFESRNGFSFTDATYQNTISTHVLLVAAFYGMVEMYFLRLKHQAESSVDALETKRAFVRYVSHEIRTPLNAATLGLQLLDQELHKLGRLFPMHQPLQHKTKATSKETLVELVADVNQACNIAVEILNDLLMYEKIDGGLLVLEAQEILLGPFVQEVLKLFQVQAKALDIELVFQNPLDAKVFVMIDSYKVSQVVRNLVSNALKFSPPKSVVVVSLELVETCSTPLLETAPLMSTLTNSLAAYHQQFQALSAGSLRSVRDEDGNSLEASGNSLSNNPTSPLPGSGARRRGSTSAATRRNSWFNNSWFMKKVFPTASSDVYRHMVKPDPATTSRCGAWTSSCFSATSSSTSGGTYDGNQMVRLSVHDSGAGISKENQKKLFHEIVQFDAAKLQQGKGSGIGLWISNRIMKLHGGKIRVESEGEGCGSTFSIDIPIARLQETPRTNRVAMKHMLRSILATDLTGDDLEAGTSSRIPNPPVHHTNSTTTGFAGFISRLSSIDDGHNHHNNGPNQGIDLDPQQRKRRISDGSANSIVQMVPGFLSRQNSSAAIGGSLSTKPPGSSAHHHHHAGHHHHHSITRVRRILVIDDSQVNRKMLRNYLRDCCEVCDEAVDGMDGVEKVKAAVVKESQQAAATAAQQIPDSHSGETITESHHLLVPPPSTTTTAPTIIVPLTTEDVNQKNGFGSYKGYDLVITDYLMPRMNGLEVVEQLRAYGYTGKIVGLTGNAEDSMIEAFEKAGVTEMLIKPIQGKALQELVHKMLQEDELTTMI